MILRASSLRKVGQIDTPSAQLGKLEDRKVDTPTLQPGRKEREIGTPSAQPEEKTGRIDTPSLQPEKKDRRNDTPSLQPRKRERKVDTPTLQPGKEEGKKESQYSDPPAWLKESSSIPTPRAKKRGASPTPRAIPKLRHASLKRPQREQQRPSLSVCFLLFPDKSNVPNPAELTLPS